MRAVLALMCVFALSGCTDADRAHIASLGSSTWDGNVAPETPSTADSTGTPGHVSGKPIPECQLVASDRASDAAAQGFDEDTQAAVYGRTYADCATWAARGSAAR